ncbi:MAG: HU family DNA-binding protein [Chloroflexi bacterium]|nr:HU family DNA-binding protein [Chloroflexota bacterium]
MNKTELVKRIARESKVTHSPLTQAQVQQVLDALFATLTEELSQPGGRVEIEHFGVLESRLMRNSPHGQLIGRDGVVRQPPSERLVITFRCAKRVRQLNNR